KFPLGVYPNEIPFKRWLFLLYKSCIIIIIICKLLFRLVNDRAYIGFGSHLNIIGLVGGYLLSFGLFGLLLRKAGIGHRCTSGGKSSDKNDSKNFLNERFHNREYVL